MRWVTLPSGNNEGEERHISRDGRSGASDLAVLVMYPAASVGKVKEDVGW